MSGQCAKPSIRDIQETLERFYHSYHPLYRAYTMQCPKCKKIISHRPHYLTTYRIEEAMKELYFLKGWLAALNNKVEKVSSPNKQSPKAGEA